MVFIAPRFNPIVSIFICSPIFYYYQMHSSFYYRFVRLRCILTFAFFPISFIFLVSDICYYFPCLAYIHIVAYFVSLHEPLYLLIKRGVHFAFQYFPGFWYAHFYIRLCTRVLVTIVYTFPLFLFFYPPHSPPMVIKIDLFSLFCPPNNNIYLCVLFFPLSKKSGRWDVAVCGLTLFSDDGG